MLFKRTSTPDGKQPPLPPLAEATNLPFLSISLAICILITLLGTLVIPDHVAKPLQAKHLLGKAQRCPQILDPHLELFSVPYNSTSNAISTFTVDDLGQLIGFPPCSKVV